MCLVSLSTPPPPDATPRATTRVVPRLSNVLLVGMVAAVSTVGLLHAVGVSTKSVGLDLAFWGALLLGCLAARPILRRFPDAPTALLPLAAILLAAPLWWRGHALNGITLTGAALLWGALAWRRRRAPQGAPPAPENDAHWTARSIHPFLFGGGMVAVVGGSLHALWSVTRHARFGSGAWDYGCYVHNAWLFSSGKAFSTSAVSSVLGDANFWGGTNHFMPSLILTAPLGWWMTWTGNTGVLALVQAMLIALCAIPIVVAGHRLRLGPWLSTVLAACFVLHIGSQAAAFFDVHEIASVPLGILTILTISLWAPTKGRVLAVVALGLVLAGSKESGWLYLAALGAVVALSPAWRKVGVGFIGVGVLGFVAVVGFVQPALLEPESKGMIHAARFVALDGGTGLLATIRGIAFHPGQALATLTSPDVKLATIATSFGGFAFLPLLSPQGLLLGLPNLAERFFADKQEMWGLAFHYGLVTAAWLSWGALRGASQLRLGERPWTDRAAATVVVVVAVLSQGGASRAPDLWSLEQPYFSSSERVEVYQKGFARIPADAAVVAQNHFLPHLAAREHIWLPEQRFIDRADVVVLDTAASAWPHRPRDVSRWVATLRRDPRFDILVHDETFWIFQRRHEHRATAGEATP